MTSCLLALLLFAPALPAPSAQARVSISPPENQASKTSAEHGGTKVEANADEVGMHPLTILALQTGVGAGVALLATVALPIAPFLVAWMTTATGDLFGQQRGAILWPMISAYIGLFVGAAIPVMLWAIALGTGALLASAGLIFGVSMAMMFSPLVVLTTVGVALFSFAGGASLAVPLFSLFAAALGQGLGAGLGYYFTAETKIQGDLEFRFPGFLAPAQATNVAIAF